MRPTLIVLVPLLLCCAAQASPGGGAFPDAGGVVPHDEAPDPSSDAPPAAQPGKSGYERAEYLIKSEKYEEALPLLRGILKDNPNDADTLNYLGYVNRKLHNYKKSLDFYQRALAVDPDHKGAHEYLGELYLQMKDVAKAREQLAEVKRICVTNCEEAEDLAADIADSVARNKVSDASKRASP